MIDNSQYGQDDRLTTHFPWRVVFRAIPPEDGFRNQERTRPPREWCAAMLGTAQHDPFEHPEDSPAVWAYRYEVSERHHTDSLLHQAGPLLLDDAFYFRSENNAIEFKMRWG